jgi:hypothetical protein
MMDKSEAIVEKFLTHIGFTNLVYEPDGNVPPDFLADGRVAVEVRRLNQNHDSGNGRRGLEEDAIPLWQKIENLIHSLGPPMGESWFVGFSFSRPIKPWKELGPKLKSALIAFQSQSVQTSGRIYSDGAFWLDAIKAARPLQTYFRMGASSDFQSGGFSVAEMLSNIDHCINEKSQKIANVRSKYNEWWLVLTDHIGPGLDDFDKRQLLAYVNRPAGWNKVVVVSRSDPTRWLEF